MEVKRREIMVGRKLIELNDCLSDMCEELGMTQSVYVTSDGDIEFDGWFTLPQIRKIIGVIESYFNIE